MAIAKLCYYGIAICNIWIRKYCVCTIICRTPAQMYVIPFMLTWPYFKLLILQCGTRLLLFAAGCTAYLFCEYEGILFILLSFRHISIWKVTKLKAANRTRSTTFAKPCQEQHSTQALMATSGYWCTSDNKGVRRFWGTFVRPNVKENRFPDILIFSNQLRGSKPMDH